MTLNFNLIDEPWIPVVPCNGPPRDVSLCDALLRAHEWREVYDNSPLVTIALHRLLLAILYRALPARTEVEWDELWEELWKAKRLPEAPIVDYLDQWRDRFDLFSETHPFYQTAGLTIGSATSSTDGASPVSRLAHELASGNNATLFDHGHDIMIGISASRAARLLLAAQAFSMGGGISGNAVLNEQQFRRPNAQHGLLVSGVIVWVEGDSLRETLLLNLTPEDMQSNVLPPWETPPTMPVDVIHAADDITARGRVDLLTWQARLIRLVGEHSVAGPFVRRVYCTQGRPAGDIGIVFDPMKSYIRTDERGYLPIRFNSDHASWADYHSLLALAPSKGKRPDAFAFIADQPGLIPRDRRYRLHAVGMVNDQAKVNLWRHDRVFVSPAVLGDPALIETLGDLYIETEAAGRRLRAAVLRLAYLFVVPDVENIDEATMKRLFNPKPRETDIVEAQTIAKSVDPCPTFWTRLEDPFHRLLNELTADPDSAATQWRKVLITEADRAFAQAHNALGTSARALRAVARVNPFFGDRPVAQEVTT
ncbi:MAG TPA: type I-E CRISPR-associated protein Cse1/CasA [Anaerolineae bacterium]